MKVSILVPLIPSHKFWPEALDSIKVACDAAAHVIHFEVIVLVMGDTEHYQFPPSWKVLVSERLKVSAARNFLFSHSTGDFITFVDDDDCISEGRFMRFHGELSKHNCAPEMYFDGIVSRRSHNLVRNEQVFTLFHQGMTKFSIFDFFTFRIGFSRPVISRSFLLDNEIFHDERISNSEDLFFRLKCFFKRPKVIVTNYIGYLYQIRDGGLSRNTEDRELARKLILQFLKENGVGIFFRGIFSFIYKFNILSHVEYFRFFRYRLLERIFGFRAPVSVFHTYGLGDIYMAHNLLDTLKNDVGLVDIYCSQHACRDVDFGTPFRLFVKSKFDILFISLLLRLMAAKYCLTSVANDALAARFIKRNLSFKGRVNNQGSICKRSSANLEMIDISVKKQLYFLSTKYEADPANVYFHFGSGDLLNKELNTDEQYMLCEAYRAMFPHAKFRLIAGPRDRGVSESLLVEFNVGVVGQIDLAAPSIEEGALLVCNDTGLGHYFSYRGHAVDVVVGPRSLANTLNVLPSKLRSLVLIS